MKIEDWKGRLETLKKIKENMELDIEEQSLYVEALEKKIASYDKGGTH